MIAVDGKTLRRSYDRAWKQSALHLVQAFATHSRLVLGQVAVDAKSNEITALPALLEMLSLKGRMVTADAMHTCLLQAGPKSHRADGHACLLQAGKRAVMMF